ncbi:MAG: mechanosensitive ion channel [Gammaproteobacteria bacterium]
MDELQQILDRQLFNLGGVTITVEHLMAALGVVAVGLLLARWLERLVTGRMRRREMDPNLVLLVRRAFYVTVAVLLFFLVLTILNVPLTAFAFLSGAVAIGVGFGAQNIINNFISGWILMGERPIRIGDVLEVGETLGKVEAIKTRSTLIRRLDGVHIVIPNSHLLENTVVNWTLVDEEIRTFVAVGVAYGSPVRQVAQLLDQAVREQSDVLDEPEPTVLFQDFADNALLFEVYFWTLLRPGSDLRRLRSDVRFRIDELFRENDIVIAFPQRDLPVDGSLRLTGALATAGATTGTAADGEAPGST